MRANMRPFLKWPGGKFRLIATLQSHLPARTTFVEPFVGAGALFLNADYHKMVVNDINPDLINIYQQLKTHGDGFIIAAKTYFTEKYNNSKMYYRMRDVFNQTQDAWERAILFLYLNRHGFNGLCRYNLKGEYNVPFGDYRNPYFPDAELHHFCAQSQRVTFHCKNYKVLLKKYLSQSQLKNTVFYCDPPYAPLSKTANFTGYAAHKFTLDDQQELAQLAKALAAKGGTVLISNHDTPFIREIYEGATLHAIQVSRTISCQGRSRQKVGEIIACFD